MAIPPKPALFVTFVTPTLPWFIMNSSDLPALMRAVPVSCFSLTADNRDRLDDLLCDFPPIHWPPSRHRQLTRILY